MLFQEAQAEGVTLLRPGGIGPVKISEADLHRMIHQLMKIGPQMSRDRSVEVGGPGIAAAIQREAGPCPFPGRQVRGCGEAEQVGDEDGDRVMTKMAVTAEGIQAAGSLDLEGDEGGGHDFTSSAAANA